MEPQLPFQQPPHPNQNNNQDLDEGEHQTTPKHQTMVCPRIIQIDQDLANDCPRKHIEYIGDQGLREIPRSASCKVLQQIELINRKEYSTYSTMLGIH
jgi:hypothetical protein